MCDRQHEPYSQDLMDKETFDSYYDFEEMRRGWFESGKVYQEPKEALKAGIINQEEYQEIIENQERKWGER